MSDKFVGIQISPFNVMDEGVTPMLDRFEKRFGINTLNGYSGNSPLGWDFLRTDIREYYPKLTDWIELNGMENREGLYGYITGQDVWVQYSELNFTYAEP